MTAQHKMCRKERANKEQQQSKHQFKRAAFSPLFNKYP